MVGTGLAAESPAVGGRPARAQIRALKAAHAAEVARLAQRMAVDLEKNLAEKGRNIKFDAFVLRIPAWFGGLGT